MATFFSGTSNIELIEKNKQAFPPEFRSKSRLAYYSSLFNSVEINSTFYRLPLPSTLEKWAAEVPDHFRFTLKLWREITHARDLVFHPEHVEKFMSVADHIGDKKGALLIQFPAGTKMEKAAPFIHTGKSPIARLESLLARVQVFNPSNSWRVAVEFREPGWYNEQVYSLLAAHQAALVWHDRPVIHDEGAHERGPFVYLRFHGPGGGKYTGSYGDDLLHEKACRIRAWLARSKDVYVYFNNTMAGDAPRNLLTLNKMVEEKKSGNCIESGHIL